MVFSVYFSIEFVQHNKRPQWLAERKRETKETKNNTKRKPIKAVSGT